MTEYTSDPNIHIIENATLDDVLPGDHITWEVTETIRGLTSASRREGIAHHRDAFDNWRTKDGDCITLAEGESEGVTITIRRTVKNLPRVFGSVIVTNNENGTIEAHYFGVVWRASEAVLGADGLWHGVWRRYVGVGAGLPAMDPENITPGTWKVEEK